MEPGVLNAPRDVICSSLDINPEGFAFSAIVSVFALAGLFGAQSGWMADRFGRRRSLLAIGAAFVLSGGKSNYGFGPRACCGSTHACAFTVLQYAAGLAVSSALTAYILMILGRVVAGFMSGASTVVVSVYLKEIAPVAFGGAFGSFVQLFIVIGTFLDHCLRCMLTCHRRHFSCPTAWLVDEHGEGMAPIACWYWSYRRCPSLEFVLHA